MALSVLGSGGGSKVLTHDITYYVSTTGNDANDGLTEATAFRTIQHAIDIIPKNMNGYDARINVATGDYDENISINKYSSGKIRLYGDSTTKATINGISVADCSGQIYFRYFIVKANERQSGISVDRSIAVALSDVDVLQGSYSLSSTNFGIDITTANVIISNVTVTSRTYGIICSDSADVSIYNVSVLGTGTYGLFVQRSILHWYGTLNIASTIASRLYARDGGMISGGMTTQMPVSTQALNSSDTTPASDYCICWTYG